MSAVLFAEFAQVERLLAAALWLHLPLLECHDEPEILPSSSRHSVSQVLTADTLTLEPNLRDL